VTGGAGIVFVRKQRVGHTDFTFISAGGKQWEIGPLAFPEESTRAEKAGRLAGDSQALLGGGVGGQVRRNSCRADVLDQAVSV
jgi:hypothetical protein